MRKYIITLCLLLSAAAYAQDVEVNGQFVVAPFATADCVAEGLTEPTFGLTINSELLDMLTFFTDGTHNNAIGINEVSLSDTDESTRTTAIYSLDGTKQTALTRGVNIVVDAHGQTRKILVK